MNNANLDYIMDIFKTLTSEMPEHMLYRENGDSIELRTLDSIVSCPPSESLGNGWKLIGCQMAEAA